ncbi:leucine-rich repeat-containing protein 23-like isoform X3 [Dreissena polymorpha]|uniref:leucine-rich repeat-containing protein 23-like isoform X3 n=1 Tax=Dreissena polymorpha TaxID=45954 RepID=UPI002264A01C|nr:leucine-rich repeat-containing protein 23-like isoform X3 [Dreissena polymorpha]
MSDAEGEDVMEETEAEEAEEPPTGGEEAEEAVGEEEGEEEQQEEQEPEEEEEKLPEVPLTEEMMPECLSLLCKTGDGLAHAYVKIDIKERELTNISLLKSFIHLRYVDVSKNKLKDISPLSALTHMLTLKADENLLTSARLEEMPFLQVASFNSNKITSTEGVNHPMLEHLSINNNEITKITGLDTQKLSRLHTLELRGNKLTTTDGIVLPNLKNLFLAANMIKHLEGMQHLTGVQTIHLRENQLSQLDGFREENKMLQYINMRGNNVTDVKEIKKLAVVPMLRALVLSENPAAEEDDYRVEVLIALRKLERLDKAEYTEDERNDAEEMAEARKLEEANAELRDLAAVHVGPTRYHITFRDDDELENAGGCSDSFHQPGRTARK